jgi:hypothetical protein
LKLASVASAASRELSTRPFLFSLAALACTAWQGTQLSCHHLCRITDEIKKHGATWLQHLPPGVMWSHVPCLSNAAITTPPSCLVSKVTDNDHTTLPRQECLLPPTNTHM